ncbi:MAG: hypothetical protein KGZ79_02055 [Dethiobacter sp.]|jgi:hypothetical protein|nr:hypothetical protein [Dethiobacter sp.]
MFEAFKRFIDKLAKANEKEFQGQTPDCCTINRLEQYPQNQNKNNHKNS